MNSFFAKFGKTSSADRTHPNQSSIELPWIEKYRPTTIDEVVAHKDVVSVLRKCMSNALDGFPNLLFYGSPGTGKTSTIIAACKEMFGEMYKQRVLELNASDERGIDVVRERIKTFAQLSASSVKLKSGGNCPPFKMVILDEADAMTHFAQAALRRTMETETRSTRFCLICNYISKIIEPLISRCSRFRFPGLPEAYSMKCLRSICVKEQVDIDDECLSLLVKSVDGDLRRAINNLQSAYLAASSESDRALKLEADHVRDVLGVIPDQRISDLLDTCWHTNDKIQAELKRFLKDGYCAAQLLIQLQQQLLDSYLLEDPVLEKVLWKIGEVDTCLLDGASEYLQLYSLFSNIQSLVKSEIKQ